MVSRVSWLKIALTVAGAALFLLVSCNPMQIAGPKIIFINRTHSLPLGIYVRVPGNDFRDGDIVAYYPEEAVIKLAKSRGWLSEEDEEEHLFIKKAFRAGTPYSIRPGQDGFHIDYQPAGDVSLVDGEGRTMPVHVGLFRVPEGEFLPYGTGHNSFDGRYSGTVPTSRIICRVVPFLTEGE